MTSITENRKTDLKKKKLCFAASSGGHLAQILMLYPLIEENDSFIVTEMAEGIRLPEIRTYYLKQVNRKEWRCLFYLLYNFRVSLIALLREKPEFIITTGVLGVIPLCILGKLLGVKLIFIESFAKVRSRTMTGKFLYPFADYFFVQWESMLKIYPKAIYKGGLY